MKRLSHFVCFAVAIALLGAATAIAQTTFGTMLNELVDRDRLAMSSYSGQTYDLLQASSHDRNSTSLGAPANFANGDASKFWGTEVVDGQTEYIMLSDTGPGAIARWWMTGSSATDGEIRVYVDGAATPVLAGPMRTLLGENNNFGAELSFKSRVYASSPNSCGINLYAPIPYSQSVKVTYRGSLASSPPVYYNINYRKYDSGATVQSYSAGDPTSYSAQRNAANAALATPTVTGNVNLQHTDANVNLATGQNLTYSLGNAGAIRQLQVKVAGADQAAALRDTYLELTFDGQRTARVPLGHFFGNGDGSAAKPYNTFEDFYRTVAADGTMTARWVMPYQSSSQVRLVNEGSQNVNVALLKVDSGSWAWNADSMHFHANFREEKNIKTRAASGTADFRSLTVRGRGAYVGDTLSVRNGSSGWWGEGDEKVYVDYLDANGSGGNARPVHFGTGSEDYYGYAWCHTNTFVDKAFIAQPIGAGNNTANGRTVNSRVRGLDAIPFDESFKFDMEMWHWNETQVDYGAATYWYGAPGAVALRTAADLGANYRTGHDFALAGLPDTAGDGQWLYLSSSKADLSSPGTTTALLVFGGVGNAGHQGYGGGQNGHNLAAISDQYLFSDGGNNLGVQGAAGYHELALHPAGTVASGAFAGSAAMPFAVARWIAGESSAGLANINGSVRNLINNSDGIDFYIYVDGALRFSAAAGPTLPETYFDFDAAIFGGSIVDFVLGNNGSGNLFGDESMLRAIILVPDTKLLPDVLTATWKGGATSAPTSWSLTENWIPGTVVPDGAGIKVVFGDQDAAGNVVNIDSANRTVGSLVFHAGTGTTIQSAGGFSLTLDNNGNASTIDVAGSHAIDAPVIIENDTLISGPGALTISDSITGSHSLAVLGALTAESIQVNALYIGSAGASQAVPECSTLVLLGMAAIGLLAYSRRRPERILGRIPRPRN
ncbi:MAG: DUF2961 domain-containing protein [Pirellulales bacterium]|nr:DUF2961 domain-containing protein [Pirellulales bacterium]